MKRAFVTLAAMIIVPLALLFYTDTFSPTKHLSVQLEKQFFIAVHRGPIFLILHELKHIPKQQWPQKVEEIAKNFSYPLELKNRTQLEKEGVPTNKLGQQFIYLPGEPPVLLGNIPNSEWFVAVSTDQTPEEELARDTQGMVYLFENYFKAIPQTQWQTHIATLQNDFGYNLSLTSLEDLELSDELQQQINNKQVAWLREGSQSTFFYLLGDSNQVIVAGPAELSQVGSIIFLTSILLFLIVICIALLCWLIPLKLDLRKLDQQALHFGLGKLDERVHFRKGSVVNRLGKSFNRMANNIQTLITTNVEITNAIAHDLRTPLARLRFALEVLDSEDYTEDEKKAYRSKAFKSVDDLDYLINQTLIHSRYSRATDIRGFSHSKIASLLADEIEQYSCTHLDMTFHLNIPPTLADKSIYMDSKAIRRAIQNLVSNGAKHANKTVEVSLTENKNNIMIEVEDDGPGISDEHYDAIFQAFAQLGNEQRDASLGHGLGLAIVKHIANWHKGEVSVGRSKLGGAHFTLSWPIT